MEDNCKTALLIYTFTHRYVNAFISYKAKVLIFLLTENSTFQKKYKIFFSIFFVSFIFFLLLQQIIVFLH